MTDIQHRNQAETDARGVGDVWMFAPMILVLVGLPLAMVTVLSASLWFAAHRLDLSLTQSTPSTFAARWPDKNWPTVTPGQRG
jgi:hypothetical protein